MRRRTTVILSVAMIGLFLLPLGFGLGTANAIRQLQFKNPRISVIREGWDIKVSFSIDISNPTSSPVPSFTIVSQVTLDGHILFDSQQNTMGSLDPEKTMTLTLSTTVNLDLVVDLATTLLDYLEGKVVDYYTHFALTVHYLLDFPVYEKTLQGSWELY